MINALHLLWIIPLATTFGFFICALLTVSKHSDDSQEGSRVDLLLALGIPSAFFGGVIGLLFWRFKRELIQRDKARYEKEKNTEKLMLLTLQNTRAINILATATARAVQRIPDAHCNGDMTEALKHAAEIQTEEKNFLFDQGIKHIFNEK